MFHVYVSQYTSIAFILREPCPGEQYISNTAMQCTIQILFSLNLKSNYRRMGAEGCGIESIYSVTIWCWYIC